MTFTGHIRGGVVVLNTPVPLPDGTPVTVTPSAAATAPATNGDAPPPVINPRTGRPYPSYIPPEMAEKLRRQDSGEEPVVDGPSLFDRLKPLIEAAGDSGLPTDAALNHDHYLYGHPKKS